MPHVCPMAVPVTCLYTHVPRRRVTASDVNARAGFLRLQVHQSLSSGGGNLLPHADHLQAVAGSVQAGAAPAPPSHRGYLGRPREGAAVGSSSAAPGGTPASAEVATLNTLAASRTRRAPWHPGLLPSLVPTCHICSRGGISHDLMALASLLH